MEIMIELAPLMRDILNADEVTLTLMRILILTLTLTLTLILTLTLTLIGGDAPFT